MTTYPYPTDSNYSYQFLGEDDKKKKGEKRVEEGKRVIKALHHLYDEKPYTPTEEWGKRVKALQKKLYREEPIQLNDQDVEKVIISIFKTCTWVRDGLLKLVPNITDHLNQILREKQQ